MTRIDLDFAIAGVLLTKLQNAGVREIRVTATEIIKFGAFLEQTTGIAVLNGFTPEAVTRKLQGSQLFVQTYHANCEEPIYQVNMNCRNIHSMPEQAIVDALDPPLNYPMDVLEAANILPGAVA